MTRPSSSTTTASSTNPRPMPPQSSGMVSAGQSSSRMCFHRSSVLAPSSTTARTNVAGTSLARTARTESRSSSWSAVNSSCMRVLPGVAVAAR
jgi:hypothetical protein